MLPSQKVELAIYKNIKRLGPGAVTTSLLMLSQASGEDHTVIVERLKALEADNRILLSKYSGGSPWPRAQFGGNDAKFFYVDSFRIEIAPQGRMYFEELEQLAEPTVTNATAGAILSAPLVFVSCGQSTPAERELGEAVARLVEQETGCTAYFAQNQTTFDGVTENVLKALHNAVGFIAVMHPRGNVSNPNSAEEAPWVRGSVWVEQEIAIAAFIAQALQLPVRVRRMCTRTFVGKACETSCI